MAISLNASSIMVSSVGKHVVSSPQVVISLQGPKRTDDPLPDIVGSAVTLRVRRLEGLLSIADAIPHGIVLVRAETFESAAALDPWRFAHPDDWVTMLLLSTRPASYRASLEWLARWPLPVLLDRGEDRLSDDQLGVLLESGIGVRDSLGMIPYLAPRLKAVAAQVGAQLIAVYASLEWPSSLKQLAVECGLSERQIRRQLAALGIRSSYRFFSASRVLRAYNDVAAAELVLSELSRRHGFGCSRSLRSQWLHVMGSDWRRARDVPMCDDLLARVVTRVLEPR